MFLIVWEEVLPNTPLEICGTILSFSAVLIFIITASFKSKKKMIAFQSISHTFLMMSEFISSAWSSIIQEIVSIVRNFFAYFGINTKVINVILIASGCIFGIYVNIFTVNAFAPWKGICYGNWYGFLPVIANLEYSIVVLNKKLNAKWLKLSLGISGILWAVNFILSGPALLLSGIMNLINGNVALLGFFKMDIEDKKNKIVSISG